ncbi:MAG: hypothetical protein B7Y02_09360 [Rhodobacterales bacterium 17-64-5]|nr:MAG: hypothetical protein B7Y02_09360 [Rhodobacterales bacterium 17-64-5]
MTPPKTIHVAILLLGFSFLSACDGVETGAVSPCHGQFHAEGKYFATKTQSDGARIVVSTMSAPTAAGCAD